jgi:SPP1 gp7 family putative phage head morphogenesis protein
VADIYETVAKFRGALLRRERIAASDIVRAYGVAYKALRKDLDSLLLKIADARESGEVVNEAWLYQQNRYRSLLNQVQVEIEKFQLSTASRIILEQQSVIEVSLKESAALLHKVLGASTSFDRLPVSAVENLVGFLSDGSPLSSLLNELAPDAVAAVRDALVSGVVSGRGTRAIAAEIKQGLGGNMTRALTIARTETLRAYREASRQTYMANSDVLRGWRWYSARDTRTCAMCWAMHGTFHELNETLNDHPNGRCVMIPETKIGNQDIMRMGVDEFDELPPESQQAILGNAAFESYRAGKFTLPDLVGERVDPRWGPVRYRKPLREILGN